MAAISEQDEVFINDNPLSPTLSPLRPAFKPDNNETSNISSDETVDLSVTRDAITDLLAMLQVHPVAKRLKPRSSQNQLRRELVLLHGRLQSDDFDLSPFETLTTAVANNAPDLEVWKAVLQLVDRLSRTTPPPLKTILPTHNGTPYIASSASQQGSEQTRALLGERILEEIEFCTYRNVEGFFEKYFNNSCWTEKSKEIYNAVKERYQNKRWKGFPQVPKEPDVFAWLKKFQDDFLSEADGAYYTTSKPSDLTGGESPRQVDVFLKSRKLQSLQHDWKDAKVIDELRETNHEWRDKLKQLSIYMRDVFCCSAD